MLSIGKMVLGAEEYYLGFVAQGREEYYTGAGESPGIWLGGGAGLLALEGVVDADDLRSLLAGISPLDHSQLARQGGASTRVAGFDLTFSAPKSVSLLFGLGSPATSAAARAAHDAAVAEGLAYLECHALCARRGAGGERRIQTGGLVGAAFVHRTSRTGDPQLHTHVLSANVVLGEDGRWSAPDARLLYFHARTAGFVYQASLRAHLVESLGVRFGPITNGSAEVAEMDPVLLRRFSTRRAEIEEYLFQHGQTSRRSAEVAALATRSPKPTPLESPSVGDLRHQWRVRAIELGVDVDRFFKSSETRQVAISTLDEAMLTDALVGSEGLTAKESAFERRDIVRAIAERLDDGAHLADIDRLADRVRHAPGIVELSGEGRGGEALQTTKELLEVEQKLMERAAALRTADVAKVDHGVTARILSERFKLSSEQRAMVMALTSSGAGVEIVVGKAGAGKTTALALARQSFEAGDLRVSGTALSARAAEELESSAGIESVTLAQLEFELEQGMRVLGQDDVLVVDEAGMVGTRTIERLVDATGQAGSKLILVGDHRQLAEIDSGGAFAALATRLGAIELTENRRQQALWERGALDQLRSGDVRIALSAYETHGRIHLAPTMAEARQALVERWQSARSDGAGAFMLTVGRRDVEALNVSARAMLQEQGAIGADQVTIADRPFALGDEVVCLRNARRFGVLNGTRGTILGIDDSAFTISTPKGERSLPRRYVEAGHLDYGYATTVHKAQGATYDRAFVLATEALSREAGYVAMSRARIGTELFVAGGAFEDGHGPEYAADEPMERTAARLATSRAKQLALSHLEDGGVPEPFSIRPTPDLNGERREVAHAVRSQIETPNAGRRALGWDTDFSGADQPSHINAALGHRPAFVDEQARYDTVAGAIEQYRRRHNVSGDEALGDRPFSVIPRLEFDAVAAQIHAYERFRWRELDPPVVDLSRDLGLGR